ATVNTNVSTAPSVLVTDQYGNPVSGVTVSFSNGGNATTNASRIPAAAPWNLGTAAGAHTLNATSGPLGGSPGTFHATGTADPAPWMAVGGGDNEGAPAGTAVGTAPSALVTDQYGNPVSGVAVTFSVASGGGSATGLSQTTDLTGVATVG